MKNLLYTRNTLAGLAVAMAGYIACDYFRAVSLEPYRIVSTELTALEDEQYLLTGVFINNTRGDLGECTLERFAVYGIVNGVPELTDFEDAQGWVENTSRKSGVHSLAIKINGKDKGYESLEARTRHLCAFYGENGDIVERLISRTFSFHTIERGVGS